MSQVRALLFDTFGTLVDWRTGLITQLEQWGRARNIVADWPGLVMAWRRDHVGALAKVRTGQAEWANLDQLQAETLRQLAPRFGLPTLSDDTLDELARMWHELPAWPETVEALARLRAKYLVAPLSNGHVALLMRLARAAGITFDAVFGADVFRQYKPDRKPISVPSSCSDVHRARSCSWRRMLRILRRLRHAVCTPALSPGRWSTAPVSWWSSRPPKEVST